MIEVFREFFKIKRSLGWAPKRQLGDSIQEIVDGLKILSKDLLLETNQVMVLLNLS